MKYYVEKVIRITDSSGINILNKIHDDFINYSHGMNKEELESVTIMFMQTLRNAFNLENKIITLGRNQNGESSIIQFNVKPNYRNYNVQFEESGEPYIEV